MAHNLQDMLREEFGKKNIGKIALPDYFATSLNPMLKLRPYQKECFQYFLTYWENEFEFKSPKTHLLFHMATGSGKTLIMAGLMLYLYQQGYRNFLFFVDSSNIIEKTKDNFVNIASAKYLFNQTIQIDNKQVDIRLVDNFQSVDENCINICLDTIQGLHSSLNTAKENSITYDDFAQHKIVLISDEAHHINSSTKKGKKIQEETLFEFEEFDASRDWETTVMRILSSNEANILLEFTATEDFTDANIADKYKDKVIFDYPLKKFREDGYSKDISVVQSDLTPIDRAIQCVLLSQYKRKLFSSIRQDIKPVMMLKSKTIKDNKAFYDLFVDTIKGLSVKDLERIKSRAKDEILDVFTYLDENNIQLENLLLEIQEDFKEDNLLLVDGNNISPDKQLKLNSLEAKDNEFRVVFAVDMLNEGWDVLNLFDIVRLYETRDARDGKPGKTTMQEAQLIGRGARYMPFQTENKEMPTGSRKFDSDLGNRLRAIETLHYHSANNPKYIQELRTALVQTGIVGENTREVPLTLKDSFKKTRLYKDGYVFTNEQEIYLMNEEITSLGKPILDQDFKVRITSGEMKTSLVFGKASSEDVSSLRYASMKLIDLGGHIVRSALNRFDEFRFTNLKETFPNLKCVFRRNVGQIVR
jgi:type III restriction enzyme